MDQEAKHGPVEEGFRCDWSVIREGVVRDEAGDVSRSQSSGDHCKDLGLYPQWETMQGASASGWR